ncbi:patatin-like phospholipase family protein [Oceanicella sp. SM1341]|uniref:patatin-like phospholipase family protein n=1 Tax=Oceanicella sp. SM1341 TaxID=1548889 RepID=UPI000E55266D|nr:patatin-like phospholipase family protein [Oceanicella sp. SM1341]
MPDWSVSSLPGFFRPGDLVKYRPDAVGLCFSGGGYRATLFHAGAVIRLNELGLLPRIDRVSSVSGGSITSGLLAKAWRKLPFDAATGIAPPDALHAAFTEPVLEATARTLDIRVGLAGFLPFVSAGNRLADLYDRHVFDGFALKDLPERPAFVFNATNLQTGGLVRFTKHYLADWRAFSATTTHLRLADAVAASSAFPPVLAPLRLDLSDEQVETPAGARFDDPALHREPVLVDGGVHDNLGLEAVWKRCGVLIASYAGHNAAAEVSSFALDHMVPVIYSFLASSIDWRERMLINLFRHRLADGRPERRGAYWTAGTELEDFPLRDGWKPTPDTIARARDTPTRLEALSRPEQKVVVEAGYAFADAALRSYLLPDAPPPVGPPRVFP